MTKIEKQFNWLSDDDDDDDDSLMIMMTFDSLTLEEFILIAVEPKAIIPFISHRIASIFTA